MPRATTNGRRPIYDVRALGRDARELFDRRALLRAIWGAQKRVPAVDREEIMYAVALANQASYCAFTHRSWAEHAGAPDADLGAIERGALDSIEPARRERIQRALRILARHFVQGAWPAAVASDGAGEVDTIVRAMTLANLSGNTLEAFVARLRGCPRAGSRPASEAAISALFGLVLVPVGALLVVFRSEAPWTVVAAFRRYRDDFERKVGGGRAARDKHAD